MIVRRLFFLSVFFCFSLSLHATETITTGDLYPPYVDSSLRDNGLMIPVMAKVLDQTEDYFDFEIVYEPWARGYEQAKQGIHLGTFPYVWDKIRDNEFYYSDSIFDISSHLFSRDGGEENIWTIELLKQKGWRRICRPNGYSLNELEKPLLSTGFFEIDQPSTLFDCFRLLALGRVDLVPIDTVTGRFILDNYKFKAGIKHFKNALFDASLYFIVSREREDGQEIIRQFNESLRQLKADGTLIEIRDAYLNKNPLNLPN